MQKPILDYEAIFKLYPMYNRAHINLHRKQKRWVVLLEYDKIRRYTINYARLLMELHLNRYLTKEEIVDHIDENKINDSISNLQIITLAENTSKSNIKYNPIKICDNCGKEFVREGNPIKRSCLHTYCSQTCNRTHIKEPNLNTIIITYP